jgi:hypothetical protein
VPLERWLPLREEDFAPAITDFQERVRTTEKYEAGTGMLREAARQITIRAKHELQTPTASSRSRWIGNSKAASCNRY